MRLYSRALAALAFFTPLSALAQYSIDKVVFENPAPYTESELLAVSGLAPGQFLVHDSLANAGQHLLDTGVFADVQVSLSGQGKARTVHVELKPTPLDALLPVSFGNLVWFTPDELTQGIHARVPLYRGVTAEAGSLQDAIQAAVQQMLTEKGVQAKLSHDLVAPSVLHPVRVVNFKVMQPAVRLADVHLSFAGPPGASTQLTPGLQKAVNQASHTPFNEGVAGLNIEDMLLAPARDAGYVTAHLDEVNRSVAPAANGVNVTYTARIVTGDAYKISAIDWSPTPLYTAADFNRDGVLHPGDLASLSKLHDLETHIAFAYLTQGFMDAFLLATPALDETNHTVAYTLKITPGDVYRLHSLTVTGPSPEVRKSFDAVWTMKAGDPYSDQAVNAFFRKYIAQPAFKDYSAGFQASTDPQTHLVDLTITFVPVAR